MISNSDINCNGNTLYVSGLDAINGTPVIDINPKNSPQWD